MNSKRSFCRQMFWKCLTSLNNVVTVKYFLRKIFLRAKNLSRRLLAISDWDASSFNDMSGRGYLIGTDTIKRKVLVIYPIFEIIGMNNTNKTPSIQRLNKIVFTKFYKLSTIIESVTWILFHHVLQHIPMEVETKINWKFIFLI